MTAAKRNILYKIKILNWEKHNPNRKKSYKYTMISNNFCADSKLSVVPLTHRWLFLAMLLTCGDHGSDVIVMSERQVRALLESSKSVVSALDSLQSIQVLTYEKQELSLNELNRNELNLSEVNNVPSRKSAPSKITTYRVTNESDLKLAIQDEIWKRWADLYSPDYVQREISKATIWILANPGKSKKTPRGWVQFVGGWLERGWDKSTTQGPSARVEKVDEWKDAAIKVAHCLKTSGNWVTDRDVVSQELGERLYNLAIRAGVSRMRQLRADDFYHRNIIGMLKEAKTKMGDANEPR